MTARKIRISSAVTAALTVLAVAAFAAVVVRQPPAPTPVGQGTNDYVGRPAPDFALPDLDGNTVTLSSLKGQVVVLDLWATWCPPCVAELPTNAKVAAKFAGRGVTFFAMNMQEPAGQIREFLAREKIVTPVLLDATGDTGIRYGAEYLPLLVVIDRTGQIVAHDNVAPDAAEATLTKWIESAIESGQAK